MRPWADGLFFPRAVEPDPYDKILKHWMGQHTGIPALSERTQRRILDFVRCDGAPVEHSQVLGVQPELYLFPDEAGRDSRLTGFFRARPPPV